MLMKERSTGSIEPEQKSQILQTKNQVTPESIALTQSQPHDAGDIISSLEEREKSRGLFLKYQLFLSQRKLLHLKDS